MQRAQSSPERQSSICDITANRHGQDTRSSHGTLDKGLDMKRLAWLCLLNGLLSTGTIVHAEGSCPPGMYPIGNAAVAACAPIPGGNDAQGQSTYSPPQPPLPIWQDRWGAFASDGDRGVLGVATGMNDNKSAVQAAVSDCKAKGGTECHPSHPFVNGCGAFIVGAKAAYTGSSSTVDDAINVGMATCQERGDHNCRLYQSACTAPVRVQ